MKLTLLLLGCLMLAACAATEESEESRTDTAVQDFVEVNELESLGSLRVTDRLSFVEIDDKYVLVETRRRSHLLEYHSRCIQYSDGRVEPDVRRDPRRIYARADTFRGCRIKAIYALEPGQAEEVLEIGRSVGGNK